MNSAEGQKALFQHATEGILLTRDTGEIILINPAAERMFGYENGELIGKRVEVLIPDRFRDLHQNHRNNYNKHPVSRQMGTGKNLTGIRKNCEEFPLEVSLSPFTNNKGSFIIAFASDITMRRQQEENLRIVHEDLKKYANELKTLNDELEDIAFVSSHHLQEPLRKIQAFGNLLHKTEKNKLSKEGGGYLSKMLVATGDLRRKIRDVSLFTRIRSFNFSIPVNLNDILQKVLDKLEIVIMEESARIEVPNKLPLIYADPVLMEKLFFNLISNGIKFHCNQKLPVVKIYAKLISEAADSNPQHVELYFEDNGIGFDKKYINKIFRLFQKLETDDNVIGTGVGLALCRKICMIHNGTITAKSEPGSGSTFIVKLSNCLTQPKINTHENFDGR